MGWRFWHKGQPHYERVTANNEVVLCPIRPFRLFSNLLPNEKNTYKNSWLPIMKLMESAPGNEGMDNMIITDDILEQSYERGVDHVLNEMEYLKERPKRDTWKVGTWSVRIK